MAKRRKAKAPEGALAKGQQWTISFDSAAIKEYEAFNDDLKDAFWNLHDKIRFYGLSTLTTKESKRVAGTKDLWELRFKGQSGIGRGLYVQRTGRTILVLEFFTKKSNELPKKFLDLAKERRKKLEEGMAMEETETKELAREYVESRGGLEELSIDEKRALVEVATAAKVAAGKPIDARVVFERDYPQGTPKRARIDAQIQATLEKHAKRVRRIKNTKAKKKAPASKVTNRRKEAAG